MFIVSLSIHSIYKYILRLSQTHGPMLLNALKSMDTKKEDCKIGRMHADVEKEAGQIHFNTFTLMS